MLNLLKDLSNSTSTTKVIFLDMDGVMAGQLPGIPKWGIIPENMKRLERILKKTGAKLVISSSWRAWDIDITKQQLEEKGFYLTDHIIGQTKRLIAVTPVEPLEGGRWPRWPRGLEIDWWLDETPLDITHYVILDDDGDMLLNQADHFIQTDPYSGLSDKDTTLCIAKLNAPINQS